MLSYVFTNNIPIKEPATIFSSVNPHSESLCKGTIPFSLENMIQCSKIRLHVFPDLIKSLNVVLLWPWTCYTSFLLFFPPKWLFDRKPTFSANKCWFLRNHMSKSPKEPTFSNFSRSRNWNDLIFYHQFMISRENGVVPLENKWFRWVRTDCKQNFWLSDFGSLFSELCRAFARKWDKLGRIFLAHKVLRSIWFSLIST